jgi:hypothetical protein
VKAVGGALVACRMNTALIEEKNLPFWEVVHPTVEPHFSRFIGCNWQVKAEAKADRAILSSETNVLFMRRQARLWTQHIEAEVQAVGKGSQEACEHRIFIAVVEALAKTRLIMIGRRVVVTPRTVK